MYLSIFYEVYLFINSSFKNYFDTLTLKVKKEFKQTQLKFTLTLKFSFFENILFSLKRRKKDC